LQVRFPNPKCEEFLVEVNKILSHKLRGELDNQVPILPKATNICNLHILHICYF
jgi:hypothetical protein